MAAGRLQAATFALLLVAGGCAPGPRGRPAAPVSIRVHLASSEERAGYRRMRDEAGRALFVAPEPLATERNVASASALHSDRRSMLLLRFDLEGGYRLEQATAEHVGERLAVFVDGELVGSPQIGRALVERGLGLDVGLSRQRVDAIVRALNPEP